MLKLHDSGWVARPMLNRIVTELRRGRHWRELRHSKLTGTSVNPDRALEVETTSIEVNTPYGPLGAVPCGPTSAR